LRGTCIGGWLHMENFINGYPGAEYSLKRVMAETMGANKKQVYQNLAQGGREVGISKARNNHRERGIWQKRFWEHRIRNEEDMMHHVNYIHYNPVKHGLVRCPHEWPYSSFARWIKQGFYKQNWLCDCEGKKPTVPEYLQATDAFGE